MSDEQKTELAQVEAAPAAPETAAPDASVVQSETPKEYVPTEPRHPLQDILDKAAKKAEDAKQKQAQPEIKKEETLGEKPVESFDMSKWDGNVLTLPEKIRKIVNDNQAAFHEKAKEAAELKAKYEELSQLVNQYTTQAQAAKEQQPLFTKEEFEAAQLDPNKFLELSSRVAQNIVEAEKAKIAPILSQVEFTQKVAENERVINDFASKHTDFWNLYDAGILEPLVKEHGLDQGYAKASEIKAKFDQEAMKASQARVQEKKSSVSVKPTTTQSVEVTYVDRPDEVLPTAMKFAAEGKKVKVKLRPH